MKIDKFEIREEDGKLYVCVRVPSEHVPTNIPRIRLETEDVQNLLEERGIKYGRCIQSATLKNWRASLCEKEWIFEKKVLDKAPEPVILKEEKSVQPKPTRKKRTRSSIKKVSTEE